VKFAGENGDVEKPVSKRKLRRSKVDSHYVVFAKIRV
jgi:hypothetical protein